MIWIKFLSVLFLAFGGGGTDLLDFVHTDAYWQSKHVTVSVDQLLKELNPPAPVGPADGVHPKAAEVRRLMAIRTLGEMKNAKAAPALKELLTNKGPFVADYAQAALDSINGKPVRRASASDAVRKADVGLLPAKTDMAFQIAPAQGDVVTLGALLANTNIEDPEERQSMAKEISQDTLALAEMTGNIRLDAITGGAYFNAPGKPGYLVLVAHGKYDSQAAAAAAQQAGGPKVTQENRDGVTVLEGKNSPAAVIFASDDRAIVIVGEDRNTLPIAEVAAAVKKGAGEIKSNADLMALIQSVGDGRVIWAAAKVTDGMRDVAPFIAPFDTVTLTGNRKEDTYSLRANASGTDAAQVKAAVDALRGMIQAAAEESKQQPQAQQPSIKSIVDFMNSVKLDVDAAKATGTATFTGKPSLSFIETRREAQFQTNSPAQAQPMPGQ